MTRSAGRPPPARRCHGESGSTLALVPASTLIVLTLGAIAADLSHVFMAKRRLLDAAASVANDAAGAGIDPASVRAGGAPTLDPERVRQVALGSLVAQAVPGLDPAGCDVTVDPATDRVTVTLAADVDHIFGAALPGPRRIHLTAIATATGHHR